MSKTDPTPRRRRWPLVLGALALAMAGLVGATWYYGAAIAQRTIEGWRAREAQAGRHYRCGSHSVGGFPLGVEVRCAKAGIEIASSVPPLALQANGVLVSARLFQPTLLTADFEGPLTVSEPGQPAVASASWRRAHSEIHGLPISPQSAVITVDEPSVERLPGGANLFRADRLVLMGRMLSGTVQDRPVIEIALKLNSAAAPEWHPATATPLDADATAVLRGLANFAPKPWPMRMRELQAAGGRIDITHARVQQGDTIAVAHGALGLSPAGRLDGELTLTVANLDRLVAALGLDRMLAQRSAPTQMEGALGALDRLVPGLGRLARQNAGPAIVAGINLMGKPAELEGKRAVMLPLRFSDGAASLGPFLVGYVPALF
jgi:hypothetical protein